MIKRCKNKKECNEYSLKNIKRSIFLTILKYSKINYIFNSKE